MRFAVIVAIEALHSVVDRRQLLDGHVGGAHDGFIALLLQPEPDGIFSGLGEAGLCGGVRAVLGGGEGRGYALGGNVQRNGVRFAVIVAIEALHSVVDRRQLLDGHVGGAHDGFIALLLQPEPDGIFSGLGEAGLCGGVRAVLGGGEGRGYALGGNVQRNGVRFAVIVAIEALHSVVDLRQLLDGHAGGAHDGFIAILLQPEPDGIFAGLGEAGLCGGVRAVLGGGEGRGYALGGDVQRNGVRFAVIVAAVAADGILDDREGLRFDDGEAVADRCAIVAALAADGSGVAARRAGCALQTEIALIVFNRPLLNLVGGKIELHRCSGAGEAARKRGFDIVADVNRMDLHGYRAFFGFVALPFKPVVNNVHTGFGERGVCFAVRPFIRCGVADCYALRTDSQRDRMGLAVVINVKALDAVFDFLLRLVDGKRMEDMRVVVGARADDLDAVAAWIAGRITQRCPIGSEVGHLPRLNAFVEGRKLHGFSIIGKAALQSGFHRVAHVRSFDGHGRDVGLGCVGFLCDHIGNLIFACIGECGVLAAVLAFCGIGVAHACALRRGDVHRNRMRLAVIHTAVAADGELNCTSDIGTVFGQHSHGQHGHQQTQSQYHRANAPECFSQR